jgi:sugar fermentation stimulation protein A
LTQCSFLCRVNRFIAKCLVDDQETTIHVKNTGRLRELLVPGAACWLEKSANPHRKTAYDLVAVEKGGRIVNIDSQAPNLIAKEWVMHGGWGNVTDVRTEVTWGDSRFDLSCMQGDTRTLIEVKGVTLFDDQDMAIFPDAPTSRGTKHLHRLINARQAGMESGVIFVIMKEDAIGLTPNGATDPGFSAALRQANDAGVRIVAACCRVTAEDVQIVRTVPLIL